MSESGEGLIEGFDPFYNSYKLRYKAGNVFKTYDSHLS